MNEVDVSAVIVTRGNVDLTPILESLPAHWERVVWDNGRQICTRYSYAETAYLIESYEAQDLSVYGRYAALQFTEHPVTYVQDDDCLVSRPEVLAWAFTGMNVVCNMPERFRHDFYVDHALVGFGAVFHRDTAIEVFSRWQAHPKTPSLDERIVQDGADVIFTTLAGRRTLVDVPHEDAPFASDPDRMWRQPDHVRNRTKILELARMVRGDARG